MLQSIRWGLQITSESDLPLGSSLAALQQAADRCTHSARFLCAGFTSTGLMVTLSMAQVGPRHVTSISKYIVRYATLLGMLHYAAFKYAKYVVLRVPHSPTVLSGECRCLHENTSHTH